MTKDVIVVTNKKFRIVGLSPECVEHEWTGCGWGDVGKGAVMSDYQSWLIERQMNRASNLEDWVAWRGEV